MDLEEFWIAEGQGLRKDMRKLAQGGKKAHPGGREAGTKIGSHCTVKHVDSKFMEREVMGQELSKESCAAVTS